MPFRRNHEQSTWHWCSNCPQWPVGGGYEEQTTNPGKEEDLCAECKALEARKDCQRGT